MDNQKLYKGVAESIAASIKAGHFAAGDKLPTERELVEKFGVSRPTVREAMLVLEVQGLVEPRHGSGIFVVDWPSSPSDINIEIGAIALTEARALIEAEAAALAAVHISEAEVEQLEAILLEMVEENRADRLDTERADRAFHVAIAKATHNEAMVSAVEHLWDMRDQAPLAKAMLVRARSTGMKPTIADHRAILEALRARDSIAARAAMRQHLYRVIDGLLEATEMETMERAKEEFSRQRSMVQQRRM